MGDRRDLIIGMIAVCTATACSPNADPEYTGVRMLVSYDTRVYALDRLLFRGDWDTGELGFEEEGRDLTFSQAQERRGEDVVILLPTTRAGRFLAIQVKGLAAERPIAVGTATVAIELGQIVTAQVLLGDPAAVCGNGVVERGEPCDDGNSLAGDGCADCQQEPNWVCSQDPPSVCAERRSNFVWVEQIAVQETRAIRTQVPGTSLTIPATLPGSSSEPWAIFASGRMRSTTADSGAGQVTLRVNGVSVHDFTHAGSENANEWAGFLTFHHVMSRTSSQTVFLEFGTNFGVAYVDDVYLVAARIPPNADFKYVERRGELTQTGHDRSLLTLRLSTPDDGEYILFGRGSQAKGSTGKSSVQTRLGDGAGMRYPDAPRGTGFSNARDVPQPFFMTLRAGIGAATPREIRLLGTSSGDDRIDWWDLSYGYRQQLTITAGPDVPSGYAISLDFDHDALVDAKRSLPSGDDIRIARKTGQGWQEIQRVLDDESAWDGDATRIWFKLESPIAAQTGDDSYFVYYGNPVATAPHADPSEVFLFHDDFSAPGLDPAVWDMSGVSSASLVDGRLALVLGARVHTQPPYQFGINTAWEARIRLSHDLTAGEPQAFNFWGASNQADYLGQYIAFWADSGGTHAQQSDGLSQSEVLHYDLPVPPSDWARYTFIRDGVEGVRYLQNDVVVADLHRPQPLPSAPMGIFVWNDTSDSAFVQRYEWVRVRPYVNPPPTVSLAKVEGIDGTRPSVWSDLAIMAFRTDAFADSQYSESRSLAVTQQTSFQSKSELTVQAVGAVSDYLVLQSARISAGTVSGGRQSGILRQAGQTLLETSYRIDADGSSLAGYHHLAALVRAKTTAQTIRYQSGFASPDETSVECADSVIFSLRYPE